MRMFILGTLALCGLLLGGPGLMAQQADKPPSVIAAKAAVNLNTSTLEQLETLPGIGARTAALIVEYRQKNGGFKKIEELMNVKGIGEKSFLKLKPLVVVGPKPEKASGAQ